VAAERREGRLGDRTPDVIEHERGRRVGDSGSQGVDRVVSGEPDDVHATCLEPAKCLGVSPGGDHPLGAERERGLHRHAAGHAGGAEHEHGAESAELVESGGEGQPARHPGVRPGGDGEGVSSGG
jgi:hypothetical protein